MLNRAKLYPARPKVGARPMCVAAILLCGVMFVLSCGGREPSGDQHAGESPSEGIGGPRNAELASGNQHAGEPFSEGIARPQNAEPAPGNRHASEASSEGIASLLNAERAPGRAPPPDAADARRGIIKIGRAMHAYHGSHGHFPPAVLYGPDGKTPCSWRVALLPFLGERELYEQYRLDEPWDSPHNLKVLEKMPTVYRHPKDPAESTNSPYYVLVGPGSIFEGKEGTPMKEIKDGMSQTLLVVEARRETPWTKPEDIHYDSEKPLPQLGGYSEEGFLTAWADGSMRFVSKSIDDETLRAAVQKSDGKAFDLP